MSVKIDVEYQGDLRCKAVHVQSGATMTTDAPLDNHGRGEAFSPTDLVATALGTCIMTIMGMLAGRMKIDLRGTKISVEKEMADTPHRRIGRLRVDIVFPKGLDISDADRAKLAKTIESCPVKKSLHPEIAVEVTIGDQNA